MCAKLVAVSVVFLCSVFPNHLQAGSGFTSHHLVAAESVDLMELNHFYDAEGRHVYDQVIFYERSAANGRFLVRAWTLVEDRETLNRRPLHNPDNNTWVCTWHDNDAKLLRRITSRLYRESWTQVDPEKLNTRYLPATERTALIKSHKQLEPMQQLLEKNQAPEDVSSAETIDEPVLEVDLD